MWELDIQGFTNYLKLEKSLSANSVDAYIRDVEKLAQFLQVEDKGNPPEQVPVQHIRNFLEHLHTLGLSAHSQARILSGLKSFYQYLIEEGRLETAPTSLIDAPKLGRKLPDTLSVPEIDKILSAIDHSTDAGKRSRATIEILYGCGLRVSELTDLMINNIFRDIGFVRVLGKGNKERLVPIGRDALKHLDIYLESVRNHLDVKAGSEPFVFLNSRGSKISRVSIFTMIKEAVARAGIDKNVSPHTFRHSFATHLIEGGADLRAVQEMLGHESITTTEIYTHLDRDYLRQIIQEFHPRS